MQLYSGIARDTSSEPCADLAYKSWLLTGSSDASSPSGRTMKSSSQVKHAAVCGRGMPNRKLWSSWPEFTPSLLHFGKDLGLMYEKELNLAACNRIQC
jgi:hypothetical protein